MAASRTLTLGINKKEAKFTNKEFTNTETGWLLEDVLKAFGDFKNNSNKSVLSNVFLMCKSMYILTVYSVHTLRKKL